MRFVLYTLLLWASALSAMPQQVILLRHAEKPATGDTLSPLGFQRSLELVSYFESGAPFELKNPVAIYAQRSDKQHGSTRPVQTIAPLANAWQVPLYTTYSSDKYKELVDEISKQYNSGLVLICWSHEGLQDIATQFGVKNAPDWGSSYDLVWVINFTGKKVSSFQTYLQSN